MGKKKKFISKKNSVTFQLVHRSQQDPLITDETAPQHVLLPKKSSKKNCEEEHKYGIFFDDDYDYLQHLKKVGDKNEVHWEPIPNKSSKHVQLPSSVFPSEVEEDVGLLNKAAPVSGLQLDLDPDIVAAMDEDFDYENPDNILEDNFIELANAERSDDDSYDDDDDDDDGDNDGYEDEFEDDKFPEIPDFQDNFETKSRFTEYSLTSSVIRRNDQLTLLDDCFEKAFEKYDETEIGGLDGEEIEGILPLNDRRLLALAEEATESGVLEESCGLKEKIIALADVASDEEEYKMFPIKEEKEKWDCESFLSTYSNLYNHPAKISEPKGNKNKIKINKKTGIPEDELGKPKLTARNLAMLDSGNLESSGGARSIISQISELSHRPKGETPEERRERKKMLKEFRHERRMEKKANSIAFMEEKKRQEQVMINLRNNLRGIKIL